MTSPIKIDIWSDIACPWCYIGKRHLEAGIAALGDDAPDVEIEYHSFELSPDTPLDFEGSTVEYLSERKGMPVERVEQMLEHVTGVAAKAGLEYHFEKVAHTKTLKAHELLHFAKAHGKQLELKERLLKAYFTEGGRVNRIDQLVGFAAEVGLDADDAREALESGRYASDVQADIAQAGAYGIQGVPFFVFEGKYGVSGAQPAEVFANVLTQVAGEQERVA
ncbi:DsbA family oxidoreductase [Agromyces intestinalis]|uniref:DsbA family oxidoreductase n=1 Tax=Agromyces intestinalis TaxID=2592652 RepID=A0A5C1YEB5_9MICO|nr:DsbA family oxidoreductase [Agromyces intestinalis]QEO13132.1 DsbA family oxidoreductase [Agromyces intestinalis]